MKIIIFDGSFKTTPFINRLAHGLSKTNTVYILGFNDVYSKKLEHVNYVSLGSNFSKLKFITRTLVLAISEHKFSHLIKTLILLTKKEREDIQKQNLKSIVVKINPDILHVQWPSLLPWCEPLLKDYQINMLLSQRGSQTNIIPCIDKKSRQYLEETYPKLSGFHSVSKAIMQKGNDIWKGESKISKVIYTGLNLERFKFSTNYSKQKPLRLLSIGRAHWVKGYPNALQSCKILKDYKIAFHYTIIGAAGNEEIQYLIHYYGLQHDVSLLKRMPQKRVIEQMSQSDILLLPSIEEGIANVAVEAMAIGLPVISANCGGMTELITNHIDGWIVPIRNPLAIAKTLMNFNVMSNDDIQKIRLAGRSKIEEQHSEKRMLTEMESLYNTIINNN